MRAKLVFTGAKMVLTGVDLDQFNKTAPPRVKSAPGAIELNRHFGAETDLLNLQCSYTNNGPFTPANFDAIFVAFSNTTFVAL